MQATACCIIPHSQSLKLSSIAHCNQATLPPDDPSSALHTCHTHTEIHTCLAIRILDDDTHFSLAIAGPRPFLRPACVRKRLALHLFTFTRPTSPSDPAHPPAGSFLVVSHTTSPALVPLLLTPCTWFCTRRPCMACGRVRQPTPTCPVDPFPLPLLDRHSSCPAFVHADPSPYLLLARKRSQNAAWAGLLSSECSFCTHAAPASACFPYPFCTRTLCHHYLQPASNPANRV